MKQELTLRVVLEKPPAGVAFAIQKGKGSFYEIMLKQISDGGDLTFEFPVEVKLSSRSEPDFAGPVVQGRPGERFVYVDVGTMAGQAESPWQRRMKIPLTGITSRMLNAEVLEARVPGTGRDGTPACATVRDFDGWSVPAK